MDKFADLYCRFWVIDMSNDPRIWDAITDHAEKLDDDDKRLTRLEWLAVIATGWLGVLTVLLAWLAIR